MCSSRCGLLCFCIDLFRKIVRQALQPCSLKYCSFQSQHRLSAFSFSQSVLLSLYS
nr:MAG TPA: hypothetical protein [Caudoviricetes sp.]